MEKKMSEPLYHCAPFLLQFEARVLAEKPMGGRLGILLDRSAFFPGGGGQPEDRGTIEEVPVTGYAAEAEAVYHLVDLGAWRRVFPDTAECTLVRCRVEGGRRADYREQHTGQHLVSACLKNLFGVDTLSVHFGEETAAIETSATSLPEGWLPAVEAEANRLIAEDLPVEAFTVEEKDLPAYKFRRTPDMTGPLRVVRIPGIDTAACCGVHLGSLASLRLVKILGEERIRGRVRIHMITGGRVVADYSKKKEILGRLQALLTCGEDRIAESVEALLAEGRSRKKLIGELRGEIFRRRAAELWETAPRIAVGAGGEAAFIITDISEAAAEEIFDFITCCLEPGPAFAVVSDSVPDSEGAKKVSWTAAHNLGPGPGRETGLDLKALLPGLIAAAGGKGGGGPARFQGAFPGRENYDSFLAALSGRLPGPGRG
jgi:alanyl-tRNA synthetase